MVESLGGNAYPFRVYKEGKNLKKNQEWWGEKVNSGPKRKRRLLENQDISVHYTRLDLVLNEYNDTEDTENDVINSAEVVQRVCV